MVEIHGWIKLRYSDYDSEESEQNKFISQFEQFLYKQYRWVIEDRIGRINSFNGFKYFTVTANHNHPDSPFYPLAIFSWVAENSTGSYGILYYHDDEDEIYHNEFQVYILKRGQLVKSKDIFLSPYIGEVEQEYDNTNPPRD